ncbi:hypothetical protein ACFR9U_04550 [Halorientalis brevis]|uniref:Uncharacterized protein n=1 Tax=Halorientalis brevis TaxID=1126241 RepID=A0ABD6C9S4_9EURY|nr:hypothetical protein [Halorientalis brevis]
MELEERLRRELHGELVGRMGRQVLCDYPHSGATPIDPETRICYEAIRVGDLTVSPPLTPPPDGWVLDAARCPGHAVESLQSPTDGYDEALLSLELTPVAEEGYAVDGPSIELVEYSPADEGQDPPRLPLSVIQTQGHDNDWGIFRLARQLPLREVYQEAGLTWVVNELDRRCESRGAGE